jgi:hypothetical protein
MKLSLGEGGTPTMLAPSRSPGKLALASGELYWVDRGNYGTDGSVQRVGVDGSGLTTLAQTSFPWMIAVDATDVYWTASQVAGFYGLWTVPIGGGTPSMVGLAPVTVGVGASVNRLAFDATGVYPMASFSPSTSLGYWSLFRIAPSASGPALITRGPGGLTSGTAGAIAVAAGNVYWHRGDGVLWSAPITGGFPTMVDPNFWVTMMAADSTGLYGPTGCGFGTPFGNAINATACAGAFLAHRLP